VKKQTLSNSLLFWLGKIKKVDPHPPRPNYPATLLPTCRARSFSARPWRALPPRYLALPVKASTPAGHLLHQAGHLLLPSRLIFHSVCMTHVVFVNTLHDNYLVKFLLAFMLSDSIPCGIRLGTVEGQAIYPVHSATRKQGASTFRVCLVHSKFQKFYKISRHIESLDAYMEH
jgi:hypothetical protein